MVGCLEVDRLTIPTRCTPCPGKKRAVLGWVFLFLFFSGVEDCHRRCAEAYVAVRMEGGRDRMELRAAVGASLVVDALRLAIVPCCGRAYMLESSFSVARGTLTRREECPSDYLLVA